MKSCCVPMCRSKWTVDCDGSSRKYHAFPKDQVLKEEWIRVLGMQQSAVKKYSTVCSDHFRLSDYGITNYGDFPGFLKKGTIPSQNLPNSKGKSQGAGVFPKISRPIYTLPIPVEFVPVKSEPMDDVIDESHVQQEPDRPMVNNNLCDEEKNHPVAVTTKNAPVTVKAKVRTCGTQASFINLRISYTFISDTELVYSTGFERSKFNLISHTLDKYSPISENTVCVKKDSLLVTLFMLRHSMNMSMVGFIFGLSRHTISGVINELIDKLNGLLKRENVWHKSFRDSRQFRTLLEKTEEYLSRKNVSGSDEKTNDVTVS